MACKRSAVRTRYSPLPKKLINYIILFTVYILYSSILDRFYVGSTGNLEDRIYRHNNSGSKSTKAASDWILVYSEIFQNRPDAVKRELEIKRRKSRKYVESLILNSKK